MSGRQDCCVFAAPLQPCLVGSEAAGGCQVPSCILTATLLRSTSLRLDQWKDAVPTDAEVVGCRRATRGWAAACRSCW